MAMQIYLYAKTQQVSAWPGYKGAMVGYAYWQLALSISTAEIQSPRSDEKNFGCTQY